MPVVLTRGDLHYSYEIGSDDAGRPLAFLRFAQGKHAVTLELTLTQTLQFADMLLAAAGEMKKRPSETAALSTRKH